MKNSLPSLLLSLLLLSSSFLLLPSQGNEEAEWEEMGVFLRAYQLHKAHEKHLTEQLSQGKGEGAHKPHNLEPDTPWLKTCAGWTAQELCSTIFGSGLDEETAVSEDVGYIPRAAVDFWVDYDDRSVVTACKWDNPLNMTYKSIWRNGIGCTLVERLTEEEIRAQDLGNQEPPTPLDPNIPWPRGEGFFPERTPEGVDVDCLQKVVRQQFRAPIINTRAIVIVYKGELILEQYAPKITKENRLLGWSATKSLTGSLIGIVAGQGGVEINKPAPVPEWREDENDPRQNITIDQMLRMSSGTRWVGDIVPTTKCIFYSNDDCAHVCALQPLESPPGEKFNYNSGSSYILSRIALEKRKDQAEFNNYEWAKRVLFYPIGAHSMYIEHQPNSLFLGGAYGYGKPRDWARFGLLYLRNGIWIDGNQILPDGWVKYVSTPSSTTPNYGAHFWRMPNIDDRLFYASGFRNQNVFIMPNQEMVVVRMAMPPLAGHPVFDAEGFVSSIAQCVRN